MDIVIKTLLRSLQPFLTVPNLLELSVRAEKEIWLESEGTGYERIETPELTYDYWLNLCYTIANYHDLYFDPLKQPRLSTALPQGHRFEALIGSAVETSLSISIRLRRNILPTLEEYGLKGELKERLISDVKSGKTILVSGGTSTGKTTFLNGLISYIPQHLRILTLEDTRELHVPHPHHVPYILSRNEEKPIIDYPKAIDHLLRSRPDIIIMGELSITNAFPILRLLNTGHRGFMCTLHANSPELALDEAIPTNIRLSGRDIGGLSQYLRKTVDVVAQLERVGRCRRVSHLFYPQENTLMNLTSLSPRKGF